jgi:hypothetical protein
MPSRFQLAAAIAVVLSAWSCQGGARDQLRAAFIEEYGAASDPTVGFMGDSTHLFVLFDGPPFKPLADSLVAGRQREVALFALAHFQARAVLDSITVVFNEHDGIAGANTVNSASGRFAVANLR